jgi:predicted metal-binding membrane protein
MNLLWVAAIAGFVLIEKVAPGGDRLGRVAGVMLAGWGVDGCGSALTIL